MVLFYCFINLIFGWLFSFDVMVGGKIIGMFNIFWFILFKNKRLFLLKLSKVFNLSGIKFKLICCFILLIVM